MHPIGAFQMISRASTPGKTDCICNTCTALQCRHSRQDVWCGGAKDDSPPRSFQESWRLLLLHRGWRLLAAPPPSIWCSCHIPVRRTDKYITIQSRQVSAQYHHKVFRMKLPCASEPRGSGTALHRHQWCEDVHTSLEGEEGGDVKGQCRCFSVKPCCYMFTGEDNNFKTVCFCHWQAHVVFIKSVKDPDTDRPVC